MHLNDAHASLPASVCPPCAEAARHSHSLNLHREHPLGRNDGCLGAQPVAGRSFFFFFHVSLNVALHGLRLLGRDTGGPPSPAAGRRSAHWLTLQRVRRSVWWRWWWERVRGGFTFPNLSFLCLMAHGNRTCHRGS